MIVRILSSSPAFPAVNYNTGKMAAGRGELMAVRNFGALQGLAGIRPGDYKNYLQMVSATGKVKKPQFHAAISAEGRSYDKHQLTDLAIRWLQEMGYGDQPFLVVFHNDTANHHIHAVTTRVTRTGKKISSGFENIRAVQNLNKLLGLDEKHNTKQDISNALSYAYSTVPQFKMLLESLGYKLTEKDAALRLIRSGRVQAGIPLATITAGQCTSPDKTRIAQLKALFYKYAPRSDASAFEAHLREKHGIALLFHARDGLKPYGYTIIDHAVKAVYKGSAVMPLKQLSEMCSAPGMAKALPAAMWTGRDSLLTPSDREYYRAMLSAAAQNYPDIRQGLRHIGMSIKVRDDRYFLADPAANRYMPLDQVLGDEGCRAFIREFGTAITPVYEGASQQFHIPVPQIAPSVDDEAVNGRRRRRKSRTGSRNKK